MPPSSLQPSELSNDDDDAGGGDGDDVRLCGCRVKLNLKVKRCKSDTPYVLAITQ